MDFKIFIESLSDLEKKEFRRLLSDNNPNNKTLIIDWINKQPNISTRLCNILKDIWHYGIGKIKFIEDIEVEELKRVRGCGRQTVTEFYELRGII